MHPYSFALWKQSPLLRILVPYILGLIFADNVFVSVGLIFLLFVFFLCTNVGLFFIPLHLKFRWRKTTGISLLLLCFLFGIMMCREKTASSKKSWYGHCLNPDAVIGLTIQSAPEHTSKTIKCYAEVISVHTKNEKHLTNGKILVYFTLSASATTIKYGDSIFMVNKLQKISSPKNPGDFNYDTYLKRRNIHHQAFLKPADFQIKKLHYKPLYAYIIDLKNGVLYTINKYISGPDEKGIAEALLIGYKENLGSELTKTYTNTGVVHIIAISGLHLGLIYLVLVWLADRIPILNRHQLFKYVIIIVSLWIFSILTGSSASVLRSAVMFTFIVLGKLLSRDSSIVNSLAASALILLCYDPFLLWDVGFQLSYLAIIGIITFQTPIYKLFNKPPFLIDSIWKLTAVTLSAQVFTFPACIYYFQQFPNYFLLSNLIAVPLSTIILFEELFLVVFSGWDAVAHLIGIAIEHSIRCLNIVLRFINKLPYAVIDNIPADSFITLAMYVLLIAVVYFMRIKSKLNLYRILIAFALLSISISACCFRLQFRSAIIVYAIKKHLAVDVINGYSIISCADATTINEIDFLRNATTPTKKRLSLPSGNLNFIRDSVKLISYPNKKLLLINGPIELSSAAKKLNIDLLVVSRLSAKKFQHYLETLSPKMVVACNFESFHQQKLCADFARKHAIHYHDVQEKGAFYLNCDKD